jgi:hypothetical protein
MTIATTAAARSAAVAPQRHVLSSREDMLNEMESVAVGAMSNAEGKNNSQDHNAVLRS